MPVSGLPLPKRRKIVKTCGFLLVVFVVKQLILLSILNGQSVHRLTDRDMHNLSTNKSLSYDVDTNFKEIYDDVIESYHYDNRHVFKPTKTENKRPPFTSGKNAGKSSTSNIERQKLKHLSNYENVSNDEIVDFFQMGHESQREPFVNLHRFSFSIQSNLCSLKSSDIVIFVHSATSNKDRRKLIRKSWGRYEELEDITLATVFMIGQTGSETLQRELETEAEQHGDLVQGNFLDSYRNMTFKHMMALHWVLTNCHSAKLFVKVDDDVLINVFNLVRYVRENGFRSNFLYCHILLTGYTMRQQKDKWYVSQEEYPFQRYPPYCKGMAYLMSPDVARLLYNASKTTRSYWVDDVYVTGILALKIGQKLTEAIDGHGAAIMRGYHRGSVQNYMFLLGTQFYKVLWKSLMENTPDNLKLIS